eukprot:COSAG02_NODE_891_length_16139_cov_29.045885_7_plen_85_part_00
MTIQDLALRTFINNQRVSPRGPTREAKSPEAPPLLVSGSVGALIGGAITLWDPRYIGIFTPVNFLANILYPLFNLLSLHARPLD